MDPLPRLIGKREVFHFFKFFIVFQVEETGHHKLRFRFTFSSHTAREDERPQGGTWQVVVHLLLMAPTLFQPFPLLTSSHRSPRLGLWSSHTAFPRQANSPQRVLPTVRISVFSSLTHLTLRRDMLVTSLIVDVSSSFVLFLDSKFLRPPTQPF